MILAVGYGRRETSSLQASVIHHEWKGERERAESIAKIEELNQVLQTGLH